MAETSPFRRLAWSSLAGHASEQLALAAAPLVAVLTLGAGPAGTAWLQTAQTLPFLLLAIPLGVLADATSRRRLMLAAEGLRALALAGVLALLLGGELGLRTLAGLGFLGAVGTVAYSVAIPAMTPVFVTRARLAEANRILELARSIAFAAGPALGGALVGWAGASLAYALATALSLAAALLLARLPDSTPETRRQGPGLLRAVRDGAAFALGHALLRPLLLTAILFNLSWFLLQAVFVAYAAERLGLSAAAIGLVLGLYGAGMVGGALAAAPLSRRLGCGAVIGLGPASAALGALLVLATLAAPAQAGTVLAGLAFLLFGAGPILWTIGTTTLRQAVTPPVMLGRVSALMLTATFGARPLGAALGAVLAARYGTGACLWTVAAGFLAQAAVIAASPVPRLRSLPDGASLRPAA